MISRRAIAFVAVNDPRDRPTVSGHEGLDDVATMTHNRHPMRPSSLTERLFQAIRHLILPGAAAALAACGDSDSPPDVETCPDDLVTLSVNNPASASPSFIWTPACAVATLEASALAPASGVAWAIDGRMQNILPSGVIYGHVPTGGEESTAPVVLQTGVTYEVRVRRAVASQQGVVLGGGGSASFTH